MQAGEPRAIPNEVQEIAEHYGEATGVPCMILDVLYGVLQGNQCKFCTTVIEPQMTIAHKCIETHLHHARLSERFGGSYVYFCNSPMLYWVSPVIMHGRMDWALIAGPVLVMDPFEAIQELVGTQGTVDQDARRLLEGVASIDISRVHHLSEVLRMCAGWASGYTEYRMVETRQTVQLQSRLSEFIHQLKQEATDEESARQYPLEQEEQLQDAIRWGDRKEAQRIMNELLGKIYFVDGNSMDRITFRVMELISLLSRAAIQGGAPSEEIMEISYRCQREIGYYSSIEGMSLWLSKVLHQYTDLVFASMDAEYGTIISQALRFIRKHYQGRITLEETAAAVSLSVPYFSRLFNEKMRISFSSYVNRLRVEQAERLLLNTNLSLVDIAGMVGFEDQSYFSKVFKGVTTITPGQYRRRAGRFPSDNQEIHERPSQREKS